MPGKTRLALVRARLLEAKCPNCNDAWAGYSGWRPGILSKDDGEIRSSSKKGAY
jgi:hypothetical protein